MLSGRVSVVVLLLGDRLDLRDLPAADGGAPAAPLPVTSGAFTAYAFRYGVVVCFGASPLQEAALIAELAPRVINRLPKPLRETDQLLIGVTENPDQVDAAGTVRLADASPERLQVVAAVLSKSIVLSHQEQALAEAFDNLEPFSVRLAEEGRVAARDRSLLRQIGRALLARQRALARVEANEKPDVLWDHPALERLHARLAEEFELAERSQAIERKLALIGDSSATMLNVIDARRSVRLEWIIILLIAFEIVLSLYDRIAR